MLDFEKIKMLNSIFDTHAHYNDPVFNNNQNEIIEHIKQNGISNVCNISANLKECQTSIELANKYDFFVCAIGIYPENVYNKPIKQPTILFKRIDKEKNFKKLNYSLTTQFKQKEI